MSKNKQIHKKQLKKIINKSIENSDFMFTSAKSLTDWYYYEKYIENNFVKLRQKAVLQNF